MTAMQPVTFDYINTRQYRQLLEADLVEMHACLAAGAWKAAMVLAGSLIEAVLVEHLEWLSPVSEERRIRKMTLNDVIAECEGKGEITDTTAKLCSAVKDYRNLIHPGKVVRDSVAAPDQNNAIIVTALVGRIVLEVAVARRKHAGLTAEQVLNKLERDNGAIAIFPHLLKGISVKEKLRLISDVLPSAYSKSREFVDDEYYDSSLVARIASAYRLTARESPELAREAAEQFHALVISGDANEILHYREALFKPADLEHLSEDSREVVIDHLIGVMVEQRDGIPYSSFAGIAPFLTQKNFARFVAPILKQLRMVEAPHLARNFLLNELPRLPDELKPAAQKHLSATKNNLLLRGNSSYVAQLDEIIDWIELPF